MTCMIITTSRYTGPQRSERNIPMAVSSIMRCVICYVAPESSSYEDYIEKLALFIINLSLSPL